MFSKVCGAHEYALGQRGGLRSLPLLIVGGGPCPVVVRQWVDMMMRKFTPNAVVVRNFVKSNLRYLSEINPARIAGDQMSLGQLSEE
ncbi:jg23953 [Pararge aegeria aegeria]|uniref:Jg23953 protein n=1 Tax=Pararge aegeria aegeria TaxID=348720 RepID=A0A8S4R4A0_9NEOP|nr:jg23953 [Pararge aegeria aegeria]